MKTPKVGVVRKTANNRLSWFRAFAWRGKVRQYGQSECVGHEVIVTNVTNSSVQYVTHDLMRVEFREVLFEDFFKVVACRNRRPA